MKISLLRIFICFINGISFFTTHAMEKNYSPIPENFAPALQKRYPKFLEISPCKIEDPIIYFIYGRTEDDRNESIVLSKKKDTRPFYDNFLVIGNQYIYTIDDKGIINIEEQPLLTLDRGTALNYWHECHEYHVWLNQQSKNSELKEIQ